MNAIKEISIFVIDENHNVEDYKFSPNDRYKANTFTENTELIDKAIQELLSYKTRIAEDFIEELEENIDETSRDLEEKFEEIESLYESLGDKDETIDDLQEEISSLQDTLAGADL